MKQILLLGAVILNNLFSPEAANLRPVFTRTVEEAEQIYRDNLLREANQQKQLEEQKRKDELEREKEYWEGVARKEREKNAREAVEKPIFEKELLEKSPVEYYFNLVFDEVSQNEDIHDILLSYIESTGNSKEIKVADGFSNYVRFSFKDSKIEPLLMSPECFKYFPLESLFEKSDPRKTIEIGPFKGYQLRVKIYRPWFPERMVNFLNSLEKHRNLPTFWLVLVKPSTCPIMW